MVPGKPVRIQPERVEAAPVEARVASAPLTGRMVRLRWESEPGTTKIPAEASTHLVAAFDTQSLYGHLLPKVLRDATSRMSGIVPPDESTEPDDT